MPSAMFGSDRSNGSLRALVKALSLSATFTKLLPKPSRLAVPERKPRKRNKAKDTGKKDRKGEDSGFLQHA